MCGVLSPLKREVLELVRIGKRVDGFRLEKKGMLIPYSTRESVTSPCPPGIGQHADPRGGQEPHLAGELPRLLAAVVELIGPIPRPNGPIFPFGARFEGCVQNLSAKCLHLNLDSRFRPGI